ncbi:MAG: PmoA family protein [Bacteroidales bacterium]|nr:PmoA family protein [Bacteroidales bacterium]
MEFNRKHTCKSSLAIIVLIFFTSMSISCGQSEPLTQIIVETGDYERNNTPVHASLEAVNYSPQDRPFVLVETTGDMEKKVPCQVESGKTDRLWWILDGNTSENTRRTFELRSGSGETTNLPTMDYIQDEESLVLKKGDQSVLSYRYALYPAPEGVNDLYSRNAYIHPLYSPSGNVLTRIQPPDHYHHYGIWNPWTKTHFDGRAIDFWNLGKGEGTVRFNGFITRVKGPVYSGFETLQKHIDLKGDTTAINERWDVRVWNIDIKGKEVFLWDLTTTLNCATDKPVMLNEYRYGGGIGFRAVEDWKKENIRVLTSEGKNRKQADGSRARWCITWADVKGKQPSGILFMSNPANREFPEPMRVWPPDANEGRGDFFFEFCPIRHASWELKPGELYTLKYRMMVFDGEFLTTGKAEEIWNDFAHPPRVMVK